MSNRILLLVISLICLLLACRTAHNSTPNASNQTAIASSISHSLFMVATTIPALTSLPMPQLLRTPIPTPSLTPSPTSSSTPTPTPTPSLTPTPKPLNELDCGQDLCIALTFDDGPSQHTNRLLDLLQAHNAHATFFVLGKEAYKKRETIARIAKEGHEIGNHSWNHSNMIEMPPREIMEQVNSTNNLIMEITGVKPTYFRPPYGAFNDEIAAMVEMPLIFWTLDSLDWKHQDPEIIATRIEEASSGMIILAHDTKEATIDAIASVLESLTSKGFRFVTISKLMEPAKPLPNGVYSRRIAQP